MTTGPILIIDDDQDDQGFYSEALRKLGVSNPIHFFEGGKQLLEYLSVTEEYPFLILCDVNMPVMDGMKLRKKILEDPYLSTKGIPFIFISTDASKVTVRHAHALSIQGFFQKPDTEAAFQEMFATLFAYWKLSKHICDS